MRIDLGGVGVMRKGLVLTSALRLLVLIGLAVLVGCDDRDGSSSGLHFSHKKHVEGEDLECQTCHTAAAKGEKPGMPSVKTCLKCHEEGKEAKKAPEHRLQTYLVNGQLPAPRNVTQLPKDVIFSHQTHTAARVQCATCHEKVGHSSTISVSMRPAMKNCMECHAKVKTASGEKNGCALCHKTIDRNWQPASHKADWKQLHGKAVGFMTKESSERCNTCHTQEWCFRCHREEKPRNHTNYWRTRGHNVAAEVDRQACKACHQPDFCIRCHRSSAPPWETHLTSAHARARLGTSEQYCINCHFTSGGRLAPHRNPGWVHCLQCHRPAK